MTAGTDLGMLCKLEEQWEVWGKRRTMAWEDKLGHSVVVHAKVLLGHDNYNYIGTKTNKTAKCEGLLTPPPINMPPEK